MSLGIPRAGRSYAKLKSLTLLPGGRRFDNINVHPGAFLHYFLPASGHMALWSCCMPDKVEAPDFQSGERGLQTTRKSRSLNDLGF